MVAILLSVFFSSGLHAQNFTYTSNAEYGKITVSSVPQLMQYKVADATRFTTTDPTIDLTMDCLAANGYGQWTCSSAIGTLTEPTTDQWLFSPNQSTVNPSVPTNWDLTSTSTHLKGWFLLDNLLATPSEQFVTGTHPGCQPPGIVSGGEFNATYPTAPKVAANLNGRVRYVWIEPTARLTFKVEGFNDPVGATVPERQIDIHLNSASSLLPNGISSNSPLNRQIIKQIITNYPTGGGDVTTIDVGGINSHIVTNETVMGGSGFHSDEFDIAIDQKFLYIVWNSGGSIWAKAIFLSDGSTATTSSIVHSTLNNNELEGLFVNGSSASTDIADVDLTGIHGGSSNNDFAANNIITNNASISTDAQILLADNAQLVNLGKLPGSTWGSWGKNKIKANSSTTKLVATSNAATLGMASVSPLAVTVKDLDGKRWESSSGTTISPNALGAPINTNFSVTYASTSTGHLLSWTDSSGFFSCSGYSGSQTAHEKGDKTLSMETEKSLSDTCAHLKEWLAVKPHDETTAKLQYDTLKQYIERCSVSDTVSWRAFGHIDGSVQFMSADTNRFEQFRKWLISVLYLNTKQPEYFCACMGSIAYSYQNAKYAPLGSLAVLNYLRASHSECWGSGLDKEYAQDSAYDLSAGYDPNHLPSLDSLGLGFLLLHNGAATPSPTSPSQTSLVSFSSNPNPFKDATTLEYTLNRMTYISVAIYDELGRPVWGDGKGSSLEAGKHQIHLDGSAFPNGVFYARISTGFGEVKTVKLVKEF